jgi:hypothetical protein
VVLIKRVQDGHQLVSADGSLCDWCRNKARCERASDALRYCLVWKALGTKDGE